MKTKRGIELNLNESEFKYSCYGLSFYFSSKISAVVPIDFNQLNCTINQKSFQLKWRKELTSRMTN